MQKGILMKTVCSGGVIAFLKVGKALLVAYLTKYVNLLLMYCFISKAFGIKNSSVVPLASGFNL